MGKQDDLKTISALLEEAAEHGLEAEVIYFALRYMQEDPTMSPAIAFQYGCEEWIK